ncbi:MAG: hypothetical protein AB1489_24225, partial [Acidobacteriota bacterium]
MIYVNMKNTSGIIANITRFEQAFLEAWGLQIISRKEDNKVNTIQLAINTKTHEQDELVQILIRKYFTDRIIGFQ